MSGHSKWAQIKHQKGVKDQRKGMVFSKMARLIAVAARGGADQSGNFKLRLAVDQAKAAGMPKDNIERAIAKGAGTDTDGTGLQEISYEIYGPGGAAILVECVTDNAKRTLGEVKALLVRTGSKLGSSGSVAYLFDKRGTLYVDVLQSRAKVPKSMEDMELDLIETGAEDVRAIGEEALQMIVASDAVESCRQSLLNKGYTVEKALIELVPRSTIKVESAVAAEQLQKLLAGLDNMDDVVEVYTNLA